MNHESIGGNFDDKGASLGFSRASFSSSPPHDGPTALPEDRKGNGRWVRGNSGTLKRSARSRLLAARPDVDRLDGSGALRIEIVKNQFTLHRVRNVAGDFDAGSPRQPPESPFPRINFSPSHGHIQVKEDPLSVLDNLGVGGHRR